MAVTNYVKEEWQKADTLADSKRKGTVGFALTTTKKGNAHHNCEYSR